MNFVRDVMEMPVPPPTDKTFGKVLQIKQQVAQSLMTTTVRVRDGLLRPTSDDGFDRVRAAIDAASAAQNDDDADEDIFA